MGLIAVASGVLSARRRGGADVRWAATGRAGGVSRGPYATANLSAHVGDDPESVARNRARLARTVGAESVAVVHAQHGSAVAYVDGPGDGPPADALVSDRIGLALAALAADCTTVALVGDDDESLAVVHCGWRGLVAGVIDATVGALTDRSASVSAAVVGPSVCGLCYPVPRERVDEVRDGTSAEVAAAAVVTCADGQPGLDVGAGVVRQLRMAAPTAVITRVSRCTVTDPALFSYRRDGRTGRHGLVVVRQVQE